MSGHVKFGHLKTKNKIKTTTKNTQKNHAESFFCHFYLKFFLFFSFSFLKILIYLTKILGCCERLQEMWPQITWWSDTKLTTAGHDG